MTALTVLGLSIAVQIAAAAMALILIRRTGWMTAWALIAAGLGLMAVRRWIALYHVLSGDGTSTINLTAELVALLVSVLMLTGIILIET